MFCPNLPARATEVDIPPEFILDVHDLCAIILHCHASTDPLVPRARLLEIYKGNTSLKTLTDAVLPADWDHVQPGQRRIAYVLRSPTPYEDLVGGERTTVDTFATPEGVAKPDDAPLSRREIEDIYWRCKDFNSGYLLTNVLQDVLGALPRSCKLRARTSSKYEITCNPWDFEIAELLIVPHEACLIIDHKPYPPLEKMSANVVLHDTGFEGPMQWVYIAMGERGKDGAGLDTRVAVDLVTPQIGGRGSGGELFSLERMDRYRDKVLAKVASERSEIKLSWKMRHSPDPVVDARAHMLIRMVLERVQKLANGEDRFCRYCGKDGIQTVCSKCKKAFFCPECQASGWKYHKVWCS